MEVVKSENEKPFVFTLYFCISLYITCVLCYMVTFVQLGILHDIINVDLSFIHGFPSFIVPLQVLWLCNRPYAKV